MKIINLIQEMLNKQIDELKEDIKQQLKPINIKIKVMDNNIKEILLDIKTIKIYRKLTNNTCIVKNTKGLFLKEIKCAWVFIINVYIY